MEDCETYNEETEPGEEEYTTVDVEGVEERDRAGFLVDRVHLWC